MVEDAAGSGVAVERDGFAGAGGEGRGRDDGAVGEALDVNLIFGVGVVGTTHRGRHHDADACRKYSGTGHGLILEEVGEGGDYAHFLDVGSVAVAVLDGELALARRFYLADFAVGVVGEFLGRLTCVLGGFGYHLGLDFVKAGVFVRYLVAVVVAHDSNSFAQELALAVDELAHFVDLRGADRYHGAYAVVIRYGVVVVAVGAVVGHLGSADGNLVVGKTVGLEEFDYGLVG